MQDYYKYELQVVKFHSEEKNQKTWHQHVIPEDVYYASGYITNWNKNRLERLIRKNKEVSKNTLLPDYGIDFVSYDETNKSYHTGQVKCYEKSRVTAKDCVTFTNHVFITQQKGYLYTSRNKLEPYFRENIQASRGLIEHIVLPFHNDNKAYNSKEITFDLRPYQEEAIDAVINNEESKTLLKLITGSGKTLVASHIIQRMKFKHIVCVAPLLCSTEQLRTRITPFIPDHKVILIDTYGITDVLEIDKQIKETEEPFVIFTTFKSFVYVVSQLNNIDFEETYLVIDEVHNTLNNTSLCDLANKFHNSLYLSATVPEELNDVLEFEEVYSYNIRTAINDGVCVDYELYLPYIEPKEEETQIQLSSDSVLLKAHFLATGLLRTGKRRCIVYLNTIADCEVFAKVIKQLFEEYHGISVETFTMNCETSKANRKEILKQFSEPNKDTIKIITNVRILNEAIDIVACDSVYVTQIGEHTNDITIVQRLGRALRKDPNNPCKTAAMFIWCEEWDKCVNGLELLKQEDIEFHKKIRVASGEYDNTEKYMEVVEEKTEQLIEFVKVKCLTLWEIRRLEWVKHFVKLGKAPTESSKDSDESRSATWQSHMRTKYKNKTLDPERIELLNDTEGWKWCEEKTIQESFDDWKKQFVKLGKKAPSRYSENIDENISARWQENMRKKYKDKTLDPEMIELLNNTEGWKWCTDDNRAKPKKNQESFDDWKKQFVKLGKKAPSCSSKDNDEKRSGEWQSYIRRKYKNKTLDPEMIDLLNNTEGWKWGAKEKRAKIKTIQESFDDWKKHFVKLGKKAPCCSSKDSDERISARWQSRMRTKYKDKTLDQVMIDLLNDTEGWKWVADENKEHLDDWKKHFVKLGKKAPSPNSKDIDEKKRSGEWQTYMRTKYKDKTLDQEMIDLLNNTEGWKWGAKEKRAKPKTIEESFDDWKKQFVKLGKKTPKNNSEDSDERISARWQSYMREKYKNNTLDQVMIELLENTEGWKWKR
jgi:superfamily II DNA or RNA helicase